MFNNEEERKLAVELAPVSAEVREELARMSQPPIRTDNERLKPGTVLAEPLTQTDEDVAELIARFRTPPGCDWKPLRDDILTALKVRLKHLRGRSAMPEMEQTTKECEAKAWIPSSDVLNDLRDWASRADRWAPKQFDGVLERAIAEIAFLRIEVQRAWDAD